MDDAELPAVAGGSPHDGRVALPEQSGREIHPGAANEDGAAAAEDRRAVGGEELEPVAHYPADSFRSCDFPCRPTPAGPLFFMDAVTFCARPPDGVGASVGRGQARSPAERPREIDSASCRSCGESVSAVPSARQAIGL